MAGGNKDPANTVEVLLTGAHNYQEWSVSVKTQLRIQGVWRIVSGDRPSPPPACPLIPRTTEETTSKRATRNQKNPAAATTSEKAELSQYESEEDDESEDKAWTRYEKAEKKVREWQEADDKAHVIICESLSYFIRHEFINEESSKSLWEAVKKRYDIVSDVLSFEGLQTAIQTRYDGCQDVSHYIRKMTASLNKFQKSLRPSETLPESVRIQFLLFNLGESWATFLTIYLNSGFDKSTTTYDEIVQILIQEEMRAKFNTWSAKNVKGGQQNQDKVGNDKNNKKGKGKKKLKQNY